MRKFLILAMGFLLLWSCGGKDVAVDDPNSLDEPDKVLYDRAIRELNRSRWNVARLTLNTLINTYPDSEFLPQAKYAMAESHYREGTTSGMNQAEVEFKDYITFFPITDLADDAQLMVAMTHVWQMEKPDRDRTQAELAEYELKKMISEYPDSPLLDQAKEKLRGVQEVLAAGVQGVGDFYFLRKNYIASADRYREILEKYPDYTKAPDTLFSLAESLQRMNITAESAIYYARVVSEHPLSERVDDAKMRLGQLNMPIPEPNPVALARAQQMQREEKGVLGKMFGMFSRRPGVSMETDAATVRGGTSEEEENKEGGAFSVDGKVVQPGKPPVKKPQ
ncbi:MAG: outer membrane protein assembly factor BamD [Acidobacteria bacterium]|nr:outer membrane protein assembly factor BamD [Acidobacteriota bacterium]